LLRRPDTPKPVDLDRMAEFCPADALYEIVSAKQDNEMARGDEPEVFASDHDL
jgi:3,4-dihydroxy-2-butanone 4-phosphate synthase